MTAKFRHLPAPKHRQISNSYTFGCNVSYIKRVYTVITHTLNEVFLLKYASSSVKSGSDVQVILV